MKQQRAIARGRQRRQFRVRNRVKSGGQRPRLSVHRTNKHIYAQVIDDAAAQTLAAASSLDADVRGQVGYGGNKAAAEAIGKLIAERALAAGVTAVAFDRGAYKYHGRVAALAESARQAGLQF